jgi:hypothetical protein
MKRAPLLHAVLFLCAYAGFVTYYGISMRKIVAPSSLAGTAINEGTKQQEVVWHDTSMALPSGAQVAALPKADAVSDSLPRPAVTSIAEDALSEDVRTQITMLAAKATTAEVSTQRRSAISKLGALPLTAETIQALRTTLINDPVLVNRMQATSALRRLAQANGDDDGKIQMLLDTALQDASPAVVKAARSTIESLAEPEM